MIATSLMIIAGLVLTAGTGNHGDAVSAGPFRRIYDPSAAEAHGWYLNDHCFIFDAAGRWHLFGITHPEPAAPLDEKEFAHATASSLLQTQWHKEPMAMQADAMAGEVHLWAPHVVRFKGLYWMFYCAGGPDHSHYRIHLSTSTDLIRWTRSPVNPIVVDGFDARDPMLLRHGREWILYYTATDHPEGGRHVVKAARSRDLLHWSPAGVVYEDASSGTYGGPTESPFVVRRGPYFYLFIGPRPDYDGTDVFRSRSPFHWSETDRVGHVAAHAAEVVRDVDGAWYVSRAGWGRGGVYLAPLHWHDGEDGASTSMPVPGRSHRRTSSSVMPPE